MAAASPAPRRAKPARVKVCQGMTDGVRCTKQPAFGYSGGKAEFCSRHKKHQMINLRNRRCEQLGCHKEPYFGLEGHKARFCSVHKGAIMVDVRHRRCEREGCAKQPNFAMPDTPAMYCAVHRLPGMVDVKHQRCHVPQCGKYPYYSTTRAGARKVLACEAHRTESMERVSARAKRNRAAATDVCASSDSGSCASADTTPASTPHQRADAVCDYGSDYGFAPVCVVWPHAPPQQRQCCQQEQQMAPFAEQQRHHQQQHQQAQQRQQQAQLQAMAAAHHLLHRGAPGHYHLQQQQQQHQPAVFAAQQLAAAHVPPLPAARFAFFAPPAAPAAQSRCVFPPPQWLLRGKTLSATSPAAEQLLMGAECGAAAQPAAAPLPLADRCSLLLRAFGASESVGAGLKEQQQQQQPRRQQQEEGCTSADSSDSWGSGDACRGAEDRHSAIVYTYKKRRVEVVGHIMQVLEMLV